MADRFLITGVLILYNIMWLNYDEQELWIKYTLTTTKNWIIYYMHVAQFTYLLYDLTYFAFGAKICQRFQEHRNLDKPTGVGDHCQATGHLVSMKNTQILTRESNWHKRKVKEATYNKQRAPTMNRDQGCHLPAIYNQIIPPKSEQHT